MSMNHRYLGNSSFNKTGRLFRRFCVGREHFPICQFAVAHPPDCGDRVTYELRGLDMSI